MEKSQTKTILTVLAALAMSVCILLEAITLHAVHEASAMIDMVSARSIGGSTFNFPYQTLRGYFAQSLQVDPGYYQDGNVAAIVQFDLLAKAPGSRVVLRYRVNEDERWQEITMRQGEPLQYSARLPMKVTDTVVYQECQTVQGEIVQASEAFTVKMGETVGSGDVSVSYSKQQNSRDITFFFNSRAMVEALQVAEVRLKVNKTKPQEVVMSGERWICTFDDDGFMDMTITVTYKDGTVRTAIYNFASENPVVRR